MTKPTDTAPNRRRAFTGAWIETATGLLRLQKIARRAFTGAWIETLSCCCRSWAATSRAFTGAWIETGTTPSITGR